MKFVIPLEININQESSPGLCAMDINYGYHVIIEFRLNRAISIAISKQAAYKIGKHEIVLPDIKDRLIKAIEDTMNQWSKDVNLLLKER